MENEANIDSPASKVPDWVQADLFLDVLKESVKGFSKIKDFKANSGTSAGENYATIMLRVNIEVELEDGKDKSVSFMLKLPHQSEMYRQMLEHNNIFEVERNVYDATIPEMEQMYRDVGVEVKFGAKSYKLKDARTEYVLLEDLTPQGFKNMNRIEGLDQAHTESALRKLSQWHAASVVRVATKGPYPDNYIAGFFTEKNRPMITEMNKGLQDNFLKCCAKFEGNEEYIEQVKAVESKVTDQVIKMSELDISDINVLNHGDFWSNNMMFSHDSFGNIKDIYMVDFQIPKYGSVAQDLYYFLMTSTKLEDKVNKFDYYVKFYHENLVEHLKLLKYANALPTLRQIHILLIKYGFWAYITATGVMSAVLVDPTENACMENFISNSAEGNEFKTMLYSNPRYQKHISIIMPWLLNRGVLEDL
ncbi:uncharacterized protein LOC117792519 [Drosophila innubila]|uniref:uncharacterized protein LOC117792519 n=1 Tax=Drosophila innubila TaxID=198719 RepID=UPI00148C3563|nr:uncharacterized protein LOC117792519 [Drosophila innubila]